MHRNGLGAVMVLAFVSALAFGQDAAALKAQKKRLAERKRRLQRAQRDLRGKRSKSAATAEARKAVDEARKALKAAQDQHPPVAAARRAQRRAEAKLAALIEAKLAGSPEQEALGEKQRAREAQRRLLDHEIRLLDLKLHHEGSPLQRALDGDRELRALRAMAVSAERKARAAPPPATAAAEKALADARRAAAPLAAKALLDRKVIEAAYRLRRASAARNAARAADTGRQLARLADDLLDAVRGYAYARIPGAPQAMAEREHVAGELVKLQADLTVNAAVRAVYREQFEGTSAEIKAAREELKAARSAHERAEEKTHVAEAARKLKAAQDARDGRIVSLLGGDADYQAMRKRDEALAGQIRALEVKGEALSRAEVERLAAARIERARLYKRMYARRRQLWHREEVEGLWKGADEWYHTVAALRKSVGTVVAAAKRVDRAEAELARLLDARCARAARSKWAYERQALLDEKRRSLQFRRAVLRLELDDSRSPWRQAVQASPAVVAAAKAARAIDADAEAHPAPAVVAANKQHADVEAAYDGALGRHAAFLAASAAVKKAQKALQAALRNDPEVRAAAAVRQAYEQRRREKLAALSEAKPLLARQAALRAELSGADKAVRAARDAVNALRKKLQKSDDAAIAAARQAIAEAKQVVRAAMDSHAFRAARKAIEKAEAGVKAKLADVLAADKDYRALVKQIEEIDKQTKALDREIRAAGRKAKGKK